MNKFKLSRFMLEQEGVTDKHLLECLVIALDDKVAVEAFTWLCKLWAIEIPKEAKEAAHAKEN